MMRRFNPAHSAGRTPGAGANGRAALIADFGEAELAIHEEMAASRRQAPSIKLGKGIREDRQDGRSGYSFAVSPGLARPDGSLRLRLAPNQETYPVTLTGHDQGSGRTRLSVERDLGELVTAQLIVDDTFVWQRIATFYGTLQRNSDGFNLELMAAIGGHVQLRDLPPVIDLFSGAPPGLGAAQLAAVRTCLSSMLSFIWGPPGTGKTYVEAVIIAQLVAAGKTVLVLCPSNTAVDTLAQAAIGAVGPDYRKYGDWLRHGKVTRTELPKVVGIDRRNAARTHHERLTKSQQRYEAARVDAVARQSALEGQIRAGDRDIDLAREVADEIAQLDRALATVAQELKEVGGKLIEASQVVFATLPAALINQSLRHGTFDVVMVDEASMASVAQLMPAIGIASERAIVAGDFRQLGPVVKGDSRLTDRWIRGTGFESAGIVEALSRPGTPEGVAYLDTQFRMHPDIARVSNLLSYADRPLITDVSVLNREPSGCPWGERAIFYLDTYDPRLVGIASSGHANELHCRPITALLTSTARSTLGTVGIATPYLAQAQMVERHVNDVQLAKGVFVATIHKFQGREADTIILDLPDDGVKERSVGPWLRGGRPEDDATRLLNVAVSRACRRLIVVANFDHHLRATTRSDSLWRLLDHVLENGVALEPGPDGFVPKASP